MSRVNPLHGRASVAPLQSVLLPVDLSPATGRVLGRATLLPLSRHARLTLLHVVPGLRSAGARLRAMGDAREALAEAAAALKGAFPRSVKVFTQVKAGAVAAEISRVARGKRAELVVLGRGGRTIRDLFLGSTAERVLRSGQLPVLAVRLPARGAYRRPLLALDTQHPVGELLRLTLKLLSRPRPGLALLHAYDVPYEGAIYPSLAPDEDRGQRAYYRHRAESQLAEVMAAGAAALGEELPPWTAHALCGPPRRLIPQTVADARTDLLVLGTRGYAGVAHALLGTVAGDVLREVPCDVLVVPLRRRAPNA